MTFTIDVHHHILPDVFWRATNDAPTSSPDAAARTLGLPDSLIDFTADTTRAVAQLHYGNTFARTPNVKYIFSHAGGTIPYLATRFSIVDEMNVIPGAEERGKAADTLRRLYWDTALSWHPPICACFARWSAWGKCCLAPTIHIFAETSPSRAEAKSNRALSSKRMRPAPFWPATRSDCSRGLQATR